MFDDKRWAEVPEVADGITRLAHLPLYEADSDATSFVGRVFSAGNEGGPKIADLCCGFGRITLELARRGFLATGVDITPAYLSSARDAAAYERLDVEFVESDVRVFKRPAAFDIAVNIYISFGYFKDPADDVLFARNAFDSLKPGGSFIIETLGKEIAVRDFVEAEWFERAGFLVLTEYEALDSWGSLQNRWVLIDNAGRRVERIFSQRLYAASELRALLLKAGFDSVEIYGDWDESVYDQRAKKLIAVGRKA
jgi:SAM-dependent methyltransferase